MTDKMRLAPVSMDSASTCFMPRWTRSLPVGSEHRNEREKKKKMVRITAYELGSPAGTRGR